MLKDILAEITNQRRPRHWFDCLPQDIAAEVSEVREEYRRGAMPCGATGIAKAISRVLEKRNHKVGHSTIRKWLLKKD
jgi:hypothetical protein